jgi:hypothetical protein
VLLLLLLLQITAACHVVRSQQILTSIYVEQSWQAKLFVETGILLG